MASLDSSSCTNCKEDGVSKQVHSYCFNCDRYFCIACDKVHNKIVVNHKTVSGGDIPYQSEKRDFVPCTLHGNSNLEFYCKDHESVICNLCTRIKHKKCHVEKLSLAFDGTDISAELQCVCSELLGLQELTEKIKSEKRDYLEKNAIEADEIRNKIKHLRHEFTCLFDRYEKQLNSQRQLNAETLTQGISLCESLIGEIGSCVCNIEKKKGNRTQDILSLTESKQLCKDYQHTVLEIRNENRPRRLRMNEDEALPALIQQVTRISKKDVVDSEEDVEEKINDDDTRLSFLTVKSCSFVKSEDMKFHGESLVHYITGCCCMPDGFIVLCDSSHQNVKILDRDLKTRFILSCSSAPFDVDALDENNVVVALSAGELQYIAVKPGVKMKQKYSTNKYYGKHVAIKNQKIFLSDGGDSIKIMDLYGCEIAILKLTGFDRPDNICLNADGSRIYCFGKCYSFPFINCFTLDGYAIFSVRDTSLQQPVSAACDDFGNLIVCDKGLNAI